MPEDEERDLIAGHFAGGPWPKGIDPNGVIPTARIAQIDEERGELRKAMADLDDERQGLEEIVLEQFADTGVQSVTLNGRTVYLYSQEWAKVLDGDQARGVEAAGELGLSEAVTVSTARLSAMVRENPSLKDLPGFVAAFASEVKYSIRSRKARK